MMRAQVMVYVGWLGKQKNVNKCGLQSNLMKKQILGEDKNLIKM